jgi:hypothetical protein
MDALHFDQVELCVVKLSLFFSFDLYEQRLNEEEIRQLVMFVETRWQSKWLMLMIKSLKDSKESIQNVCRLNKVEDLTPNDWLLIEEIMPIFEKLWGVCYFILIPICQFCSYSVVYIVASRSRNVWKVKTWFFLHSSGPR